MQEFFSKSYYGNTVGEWAIALGIIAGAFIVGKLLYWVFGSVIKKLTSRSKTRLDDLLVDKLEEPAMLIVTILGIKFGLSTLSLPETASLWVANGTQFVVVLAITWLIARTVDAFFEEFLLPMAEASDNSLDDQLLPVARRASRFLLWSLGIIIGLNNAGYDVGALLAGLGIGGLALAMAAKDTVSNIFGGFTIFTDKPFQLGDRIKLDGFDGSVEEIGLRSTRIRTLAGTLVTVPNSRFSDSSVECISAEPSRKVVSTLGLTYDMTAAQMQQAMDSLKDIVAQTDGLEENSIIGFTGFGDFSMNILFIYYIKAGEDIVGCQTAVNLAILKRFGEQGLEMAFPTQTQYNIEVNSDND